MQARGTVVMMLTAVLALASCQNREQSALTGAYGSGVVSGQVVMVSGGSPAGVTVGVKGTGLSAVLGADGAFAFAGVPEDAELTFERSSDAIQASLGLQKAPGHVVVELAQNSARRGGKRRGVGGGSVVIVQFEGVIRTATATGIVVFTSKGAEQAIALTAETVIRKGRTTLTAADLAANTRVHVQARKTDTGFDALHVIVQNAKEDDDGGDDDKPQAREFEGTVASATATQLVLTDARGTQTTFVLGATTVIRKGNTPVLATDIQPGWRAHVKATTAADGTHNATLVIVQNKGNGDDGDDDGEDDGGPQGEVKLSGRVTAVSATGLTVQRRNATIAVQTNASTRIEKRGRAISLTEVAAGDQVKVQGTRVDAGTVLAQEIEIK